MRKTLFVFLYIFLLTGCSLGVKTETIENESPRLIEPYSLFSPGGYIEFESLEISYNGDTFSITNNREDIVRVSVMVVGVKSDGDYDVIQMPAFYGTDEAQYKKDLDENGWATEKPTNMVRPKETLVAKLFIFDLGEEYPSPDIDNDGYYDIVFCVHPQESEDSAQASTNDPESPIYKLKSN